MVVGKNWKKVEYLEMSTNGIWQENWKSWKMRNIHSDEFENDEITKKREKWEMHTEGPGICQKTENHGKWEIHTFRTEIWRENWKRWKFRNVHCRTWNMARKLKIMENEKHPLDDLKMTKSLKKREKWEMHTEGPGIWRKLKITENEKYTL